MIAAALRQVFRLFDHGADYCVIQSRPRAAQLRSFPSPILCFQPDIATVRQCLRCGRLVCSLESGFSLADFLATDTDWNPIAIRTTCCIVADWLHLQKNERVGLDRATSAHRLRNIIVQIAQPLIRLAELDGTNTEDGVIFREVMKVKGSIKGVSPPWLLESLERGLLNIGKEP